MGSGRGRVAVAAAQSKAARPVRRDHIQATTTDSTMNAPATGSSVAKRSRRPSEPPAASGITVSSPAASSPVRRPAILPTYTAARSAASSVTIALTARDESGLADRHGTRLSGCPSKYWAMPKRYFTSGGCSKLSGVAPR